MLILTSQVLTVYANNYNNNIEQADIDKVVLSINEQNSSLKKVFKIIESKTTFSFFYDKNIVDEKKTVSINKRNESLRSILEALALQANLRFKPLNNIISVNVKEPSSKQQSIIIKGKVFSAVDNVPLPGVTILVKGTAQGTSTDFDGNYEIEVSNQQAVLVFSYVGFQMQEELVGNRSKIDVGLREDAQQLQEVVVTALGLEREKKALGYSVQEISGEQVQAVKVVDVATSLTGKVSGLWIQNSTEFNEAPDILLRGVAPLIVIDGVPYGNMKLGEVSQDDIESINVLKGATASALYGARGGNGAIMITTKKGGNEISINSNNMFFAGYLALPETHHSYSAGLNGTYSATDYIWGDKLDIGIMAEQWNPETKQLEVMPLTSRGKNNFKDFLQPGIITNNNITFSSTGEAGSIRTSLTHVYNEGQYPNLKLNKLNANVTGELKLGEKVDITTTLGYNRSATPQTLGAGYGGQGYIYQILMWTGPEYELSKYRDYWVTPDVEQNWHYSAWYDNPYLMAYEKLIGNEKNMTNVNITTNYKVFKDAKITGRVGYDFYSNETTRRNPPGINSTRGWDANGMYAQNQSRGYSINTDLLFNYNKKDALIKGFDIDLTGGFSMYKWEDQNMYASTRGGIVVPGIYSLNNSVERPDVSASTYRKQVNSVLGIASLSFADAIFLDVTGRNDWSSTLASTERSYFYPSAAGSILISKLIQPEWLDLWKVRGSWTLSKDDLGVYETNVNYGVTTGTWGDGYSEASYTSTLKNAIVKPEITRTWEVGTAAYFFKNRLNIDVAYYNKYNYDRQRYATISSASGFSSTLINIDETIERKGLEISVNADIIKKDDFSWSVSANWSKTHSYLKDLDPIYSPDNLWTKKGARRDVYTQRAWLRGPQGNLVHSSGGFPIRSDYSSVLGYSDPDFIWGLTNSITWKNFSLHLSFDGRVGGILYNFTNNKMWDTGSHPDSDNLWRYDEVVNGNTSYVGQGVRVVSGAATFDEYGRIIEDTRIYEANDKPVSYQDYARRYRDGHDGAADPTFLKLREISIGFSMPKSFAKKVGLNSASVALTAQNVFLWTKEFRFADPDWNSDSDLTSPSQRFIGLNIKLSTSTNTKKSKL
ncbi:SusC/RagA family TonB-linked outer membrane protein [Aestuariivivens insulae]|uniref:SusC/RagA family TonB-linked outer membrane protein n=1 Tax=Aestuariivivens insulae TaxID=1621988 RepID=UPI001F59C7B4|nr:SusC/RagA family TonB-linked outer membrane protein [Aestuariivivens insulae]